MLSPSLRGEHICADMELTAVSCDWTGVEMQGEGVITRVEEARDLIRERMLRGSAGSGATLVGNALLWSKRTEEEGREMMVGGGSEHTEFTPHPGKGHVCWHEPCMLRGQQRHLCLSVALRAV